jgi:hypothetical protein
LRRVVARLEHFSGRHALGKLEILLDDQRAPQRDREEHAEDAAETGDREHPGVTEIGPVPEDDECRDREDHARGNRRTRGRAGLHDVVLENGAAAEHPQDGHRNHGRRNGRRDGEPGEKPEVRVGGSEQDSQDDGKDDRAGRQLRGGLSDGHGCVPAVELQH